ncbi:hypothetical protein GSI_01336 [Ganoderma sinense ZZ0214-1]|uniref:Uncharacterized protein n=1 Tax=Ganoderma sinense ZZ0214-1 TaxID=1077348 RepID=A0A2G8SV82_9APHY|nr:hypothetical protein GSI_01336 [Ganoderma sinense ZZ0214-1]
MNPLTEVCQFVPNNGCFSASASAFASPSHPVLNPYPSKNATRTPPATYTTAASSDTNVGSHPMTRASGRSAARRPTPTTSSPPRKPRHVQRRQDAEDEHLGEGAEEE